MSYQKINHKLMQSNFSKDDFKVLEKFFKRANEKTILTQGPKVKEFEKRRSVQERVKLFSSFNRDREPKIYKMSSRYLLLHSFSHVLINTLIYECGYGASSLQERIYYSNEANNSMAGNDDSNWVFAIGCSYSSVLFQIA